jgi:hypothetical protein
MAVGRRRPYTSWRSMRHGRVRCRGQRGSHMGMVDASPACGHRRDLCRRLYLCLSLSASLSRALALAVESICTTLTAPVLKPWPVSSGRARLDPHAPLLLLLLLQGIPTSMPFSSSSGTPARIPPLALHAHASSDRSPSPTSIPPAETTSPARRFHPLHPRAATRSPSHAHALSTHPDVAASALPATLLLLPTPPPTPHSPPARTTSKASSLRREHRPRTALPTIDKVDSRPKTIAATVKSRAHSRLASFGRIRSRGAQQPAERNTAVTEPLTLSELPPLRPTPSLTSSHKRSEPSTASYYSSETTLSDEKYHDSKSFDEPRKSFARDTQRNASFERRGKSEDSTCDPTEQYRRLVESRPRMMHQTSSRLLRMTEDDRPFTRVSTTSPCACAPISPGSAVSFVAHE